MTDTRRRVTKPAAERRREIIDAALTLFVEHGYLETTVQDIATAANVATGSVYIHFASKQALLHAINEQFYEGMTAAVSDVVDEMLQSATRGDEISFQSAIDAIVDACGAYAKANEKACEIGAKFIAHAEMAEAGLRFVEFLARVIEQGVAVGLLSAPDPELLAYLTHAAVSGTMMSSMAYKKPADFDKLLEAMKYMIGRVFAPDEA